MYSNVQGLQSFWTDTAIHPPKRVVVWRGFWRLRKQVSNMLHAANAHKLGNIAMILVQPVQQLQIWAVTSKNLINLIGMMLLQQAHRRRHLIMDYLNAAV